MICHHLIWKTDVLYSCMGVNKGLWAETVVPGVKDAAPFFAKQQQQSLIFLQGQSYVLVDHSQLLNTVSHVSHLMLTINTLLEIR